jgi:hypothetical protein
MDALYGGVAAIPLRIRDSGAAERPLPVQLLALLTSLAAFISIFLWLMLRYPFPAAG